MSVLSIFVIIFIIALVLKIFKIITKGILFVIFVFIALAFIGSLLASSGLI